jgi:secreted trypsin-like serine protease
MTAAHCVQNVKNPNAFTVTLHAYRTEDFENEELHHRVSRVIMHPKYTGVSSFNDIALLELDEPLKFNGSFVPVCLPKRDPQEGYGRNLVVAGWGLMNVWILKVTPPTLREANLREVSTDECNETYEAIDGGKVICAGGESGSCQGDSGGPLMTRVNGQTYQTGIVSFGGQDCGILGKSPSVFERPTAHHDFIRQHTKGATWCSAPQQAFQ